MLNAHELKQKQVRLTKLEAEIASERELIASLQRALSVKEHEASCIEQSINDYLESLKEDETYVVSEHALVRYFERVKGYDLEQINKEILTEPVKALIKKLGNGVYPVNGFKIKVQNGCVVTVI